MRSPPFLAMPSQATSHPQRSLLSQMGSQNLVGKSQREARLLHFLSSLWLSYGGRSRADLWPLDCAFLGQLFPYPAQPQREGLQVAPVVG